MKKAIIGLLGLIIAVGSVGIFAQTTDAELRRNKIAVVRRKIQVLQKIADKRGITISNKFSFVTWMKQKEKKTWQYIKTIK